MNAIIAAIIFTVGIFLKDFLEPLSSKLKLGEYRSKLLKIILLILLLSLGWWQAVLQLEIGNKAARNNDFQKQQLVSANSSLSNVTAVAASMDKELTRLRSQSDTDAIQLVDAIVSRIAKSDADKYYIIGIFAAATGRHEQAKRTYFKCLQFDPNHSEALNNMGLIYEAEGQTNKAFDHSQRAFKANTNNTVAALNYAKGLILHGKNLEAQTLLSAVKLP